MFSLPVVLKKIFNEGAIFGLSLFRGGCESQVGRGWCNEGVVLAKGVVTVGGEFVMVGVMNFASPFGVKIDVAHDF